jgi:site-specific DNA recombinase
MSSRVMSGPASPFAPALRFAWWGRVSTEDQQDPTLSLPRQLHASRAAIPEGSAIIAHYYDVESGRKELEQRGRGTAHERFAIPIPRDGGIQDLLHEAQRSDRGFDAVICESIERIARRTYFGTKIEHDLERSGVALFAADEPIVLNGKRATTILTRRVKQGVAEWYVLELLEKSWDGFCEHTRQGWNVGRPPYGYVADRIPHPVPARRAEGKTKSRLVPDPLRAPVVHQIFTWRVVDRLGYAEITDRLNTDLDRYPSPVSPDPARQRDYWSRYSAREILLNPKYTGYMVWNRRATKKGGKVNPPEAWVWSAEPTHEPIVSREMFEAAMGTARTRQGSRNGADANVAHPDTKRSYVLRSLVVCHLCGGRMFGKTRHGNPYYSCQPGRSRGKVAVERDPRHPPTLYVREDALLQGIFRFLGERIFGPNRRELLHADLEVLDDEQMREKNARIKALRRAIEAIEARQARQVRNLEMDDDSDGIMFRQIRSRLHELESERLLKIQQLSELEIPGVESPPQAMELLDELPVIDFEPGSVPEANLRHLFEAFRLQVRYDKIDNQAQCRVTLSDDGVDVANENDAVARAAASGEPTCAHVVCAPGRIRTCAPRSGGVCSIP